MTAKNYTVVDGNESGQGGTEWRFVDEALADAMPDQKVDLRRQIERHVNTQHICGLRATNNFVTVEILEQGYRRDTQVFAFRTATGATYFVRAVIDMCKKLEVKIPLPNAAA